MASTKVPKDKFFEKVINPYLMEVLQHPQSIEMHEGVLHINDVEGPKSTGSVEARLEAMEQEVFMCQGMVECGLNANHMMITEFTDKHKIDANDIGKHLSRFYDKIDYLQAQIYDLQNQNFEYIAGVLVGCTRIFKAESVEVRAKGIDVDVPAKVARLVVEAQVVEDGARANYVRSDATTSRLAGELGGGACRLGKSDDQHHRNLHRGKLHGRADQSGREASGGVGEGSRSERNFDQ
ncbi:40S ribosomal protein S5-1 [Hordeum vulgare]|nr:40S ribosomal protein S5-1 [Hordeum vulgare]